MKSLRNKVILSGIVLLFAFMATVGSTYAWFTVSSSTEVEKMNLQVTAAENLAIMPYDLNATDEYTTDSDTNGVADFLENIDNYSSSISLAELQAAGYATDTWKMQPATAVSIGYAGIDGKLLNKIDDARALTSVGSDYNNNTGYYIQLKFWVYSQSDSDKSLRLNNFAISADDQVATRENVVNAIRLSVWADDLEFGDAFGGTPVEGNAVIFGHTDLFDFSYAGTTGEIPDNNTLDQAATNNDPVGNVTATGLQTDVYTVSERASAPNLLTIKPNVPTLVTVNIFVEGWHSDASNNVADANFDILFSFVIS